jgi:hypothetical protein
VQTGSKDNFLSLDFGPVKCASLSLRELHGASLKEFGMLDARERLKGYRRYVYEAGAVDRSKIGKRKFIDNNHELAGFACRSPGAKVSKDTFFRSQN